MDVVQSVWLTSIAGALLFFTGGRMWGRSLARSAEVDSERVRRESAERAASSAVEAWRSTDRDLAVERENSVRLAREVQAERAGREQTLEAVEAETRARADESARMSARLAQLAGENEALRRRVEGAEAGLAKTRAELQAVTTQRDAAHQRTTRLEADLASQQRTNRIQQASESAGREKEAEATRRLQSVLADLAEVDSTARALRIELSAAQAGVKEAAHLALENAQLRQQVESLSRAQASSGGLGELARKNVELGMKLRVFEQRAETLERQGEENVELRTRLEVLAEKARRADDSAKRLAELEAQELARSLVRPAPVIPTQRGQEDRLEGALERALGTLLQGESECRAVVLSDARGLLMAAAGDRSFELELAATASLGSDVVRRLRELMPMGQPASMSIRDENGVRVQTRWLRGEDEPFLLCTLDLIRKNLPYEGEEVDRQIEGLLAGH